MVKLMYLHIYMDYIYIYMVYVSLNMAIANGFLLYVKTTVLTTDLTHPRCVIIVARVLYP